MYGEQMFAPHFNHEVRLTPGSNVIPRQGDFLEYLQPLAFGDYLRDFSPPAALTTTSAPDLVYAAKKL